MHIAPWLLLIVVGIVVAILVHEVIGIILVVAGVLLILVPVFRGLGGGRRVR